MVLPGRGPSSCVGIPMGQRLTRKEPDEAHGLTLLHVVESSGNFFAIIFLHGKWGVPTRAISNTR